MTRSNQGSTSDAFRALDLQLVKEVANAPVLVDLRNVCHPDDMRAACLPM